MPPELPWQPGAAWGGDPIEPADAIEPATPDAMAYRSLLDAAARVLDGVERSLGQLAEGSYGRCSACGAPIDDRLLEADPTTRRCAEHTEADAFG